MTTFWDNNTSMTVKREGNTSTVLNGRGYYRPDEPAVILEDTGNGYIAKFPAYTCADQDYYVCLNYAQAYDLILALSAFKKEMGFV
ncbi:MAG: hypothetical protein ACKO0Z_27990 [Betaproteobacteria bacterium]